jgi:hypothetical protein
MDDNQEPIWVVNNPIEPNQVLVPHFRNEEWISDRGYELPIRPNLPNLIGFGIGNIGITFCINCYVIGKGFLIVYKIECNELGRIN